MGSEGRGGVSLTKLLTPEKMKEGQLEHGGSSAELWERRTASAKVRDRALATVGVSVASRESHAGPRARDRWGACIYLGRKLGTCGRGEKNLKASEKRSKERGVCAPLGVVSSRTRPSGGALGTGEGAAGAGWRGGPRVHTDVCFQCR